MQDSLSVLSLAGAVLTVALVTRVQNMDDHQSLAVAPFYLLGFFLCALAVADLRPRLLRAVPAAALGGMCVLNFGACSQLLPPLWFPTEVYSGLYFYVDNVREGHGRHRCGQRLAAAELQRGKTPPI